MQRRRAAQGTFGPITDHHDGTYTAAFTGTVSGSNAIVATIDGAALTSSAPAITVADPVSLARSIVTLSSSNIQLGGTTTITLQAEDAAGNKFTTGGLSVSFSPGQSGDGEGTIGPVHDDGDGTYTATFTGTTAGSNTAQSSGADWQPVVDLNRAQPLR